MKFGSIVSAVVVFTVLLSPISVATTVIQVEIECPVCQKSFIASRIGSYSTFIECPRDLSNFSHLAICSCPYCLYSSISGGFEDVSGEEVQRIKTALSKNNIELTSDEYSRLKSSVEADKYAEGYFRKIILQKLYKLRRHNTKAEIFLHRYYYHYSFYNSGLDDYYRQEIIDALDKYLKSDLDQDDFAYRAKMTYLLGEYYRQNGQYNKVLANFKSARTLVNKMPEEQKDECEWIIDFIFEQTCRIYVQSMTAKQLEIYFLDHDTERESPTGILLKVVLQTLLKKNDSESMQVLAEYLKDESNCQLYNKIMKKTIRYHIPLTPEIINSAVTLYESDCKAEEKLSIQKYIRLASINKLASIGKQHDHAIDKQKQHQEVPDKNRYEDFPYNDHDRDRAALKYFANRKDATVKKQAIALVTKKDGWVLQYSVAAYLREICDQNDIPILKQAVLDISKLKQDNHMLIYCRQEIENVILDIQLEELLKNTLAVSENN